MKLDERKTEIENITGYEDGSLNDDFEEKNRIHTLTYKILDKEYSEKWQVLNAGTDAEFIIRMDGDN